MTLLRAKADVGAVVKRVARATVAAIEAMARNLNDPECAGFSEWDVPSEPPSTVRWEGSARCLKISLLEARTTRTGRKPYDAGEMP